MPLVWIASLQHHQHKGEWKIICSINATNPINPIQICVKFINYMSNSVEKVPKQSPLKKQM